MHFLSPSNAMPPLDEGIRMLEEGVAVRTNDIDAVWTIERSQDALSPDPS